MTTTETSTEFSPRGTAEPMQVSTSLPHYRFHRTELWAILHKPSAGSYAQSDIDNTLDEFAVELYDYCREERDFLQRMRTLRFTRNGLLTPARRRTHHEAGKKCACLST